MINVALIGCGRIAKRHAALLSSGSIPGAGLSAVCDVNPGKAESFGKQYGVPWYGDMDQLMQDRSEEVDVLAVLTPSGLHAEHVIRLAKYRKNLIVEKPMALTIDDADAMIRECYGKGIRLFVVKQNRFNVPVQRLRAAMEAGRLGRIVLATTRVRWCREQSYYDQDPWRGTWGLDGGVLANQASHHIDLLQWLVGEVESVFAKATTALARTETEDTAVATIRFKNGALGVIEASTATRPRDLEGSISILGERGSVEIAGFAVNAIRTWNFSQPAPGDNDVLEKCSVNPPDVYGFGHHAYYKHVVQCLTDGTPAMVDGIEGRKSVEIIAALYESIETGREVQLRFKPQFCRLGIRNGC